MFVTVTPAIPTLFHCPTQADVNVFVTIPDLMSAADKKTQAILHESTYQLDVTGATRITRSWDVTNSSSASSRVINATMAAGDTHTQWVGRGLDITAPNGDSFDFNVPIQSWRSMGTCYIKLPELNQHILWSGPLYLAEPSVSSVQLNPWPGSSVDLTDTSPSPVPDPLEPGTYDWTCFDSSHPSTAVNAQQCPALAVVAANWAGSYGQVAMLLVGTLIAIAAERWFHGMDGGNEDGGGKGPATPGGDADADPADEDDSSVDPEA